MTIYEKLSAVQKELKAPKNQRNNFGNYNYRSCEDILEAVKPICGKHGALVTISDDIVHIEGRFYVKASAGFIDIETGDIITACSFAREEESKKGMDGSQITGAASSYARKYALNGLFCIDDTKDSDAVNTHGKEESAVKSETKITEAQKQILLKMLNEEQILRLLDRHSLKDIADLDRKAGSDIISKIKRSAKNENR